MSSTASRPWVRTRLLPALQSGQSVLIVAHGNSLRALCAVIDDLSDAELADLNLPTGQPLHLPMDDADNTLTPQAGPTSIRQHTTPQHSSRQKAEHEHPHGHLDAR